MRTLLVPIIMVALGGAASAGGLVRAAPRAPAIALASSKDNDILSHTIHLALDGVHFERVALLASRQLQDMLVLDDGTLLVFSLDTERGANVVTRVVDGRVSETIVSFAPAADVAGVASNGREVVLIGESGVLRSNDSGRTFTPLRVWPKGVEGFERPSAWLSADGALDVLALGYNYCASVDRLESIQRLHISPDGVAARALLPFEALADPIDAYLARYGVVYSSSGADEPECKLRMHANGRVRTVDHHRQRYCEVTGHDNGRFTLVMFGDHIFRVGGARPTLLATPAEAVESFYPDHRGRALVLLGTGRLVRYARRASPVTIRAVR